MTAVQGGDPICVVDSLWHEYPGDSGRANALAGVDLSVGGADDDDGVVAVLGPNGSGKTTLFRLLCTLLPVQRGSVRIAGYDVATETLAVRGSIGIVFQSPSLDAKLTVDENLACGAALYGLTGDAMRRRRDECLTAVALTDRRNDYCGTLSGGLKRRVEIAKGLLHRPRLLLLDEPSTGLDPAARLDMWQAVRGIVDGGTTVMMTTHLIEEAERADRVVIMDQGKIIADGSPAELRRVAGQGVITMHPDGAAEALRDAVTAMGLSASVVGDQVRVACDDSGDTAGGLTGRLIDQLGDQIRSIAYGRVSLEDVFISKTGHRFAVPETQPGGTKPSHSKRDKSKRGDSKRGKSKHQDAA